MSSGCPYTATVKWYTSFESVPLVTALGASVRALTVVEPLHERHNYLSAEAHVLDTLVWLPFLALQFALGAYLERRARAAGALVRVQATARSWICVAMAAVLGGCLVFSTISKYQRSHREVALMLAPCHTNTAILVYVLLTSDAERGAWWYNIVTYLSFFTVLALAVPDLAGVTPLGVVVFWVHHWTLVLAPAYLYWTDRYPLWCHQTWAFYWQASGLLGGLGCFVVHQLASLTFSVNVNYMLHPPPGQPIQGRLYLYGLASVIMFLGLVTGHLLPRVIHRFLVVTKRYTYGRHPPPQKSLKRE
jgi:hypothetical protein